MDPQYLLTQLRAQFFWVSALIVFIECGLLFPILPGDSLLFAVGPVHRHRPAARSTSASPASLLSAAAFLGNVVGYEIGRAVGRAALRARRPDPQEEVLRPDPRLLRPARQQGPGHRPVRARSCARSSPSSPASAGWTGGGSSPGAGRGGAVGRPGSPCSGTSSGRRSPCCRTSWSWRCWPSWPCRSSRPLVEYLRHRRRVHAMADETVDAVEDVRGDR